MDDTPSPLEFVIRRPAAKKNRLRFTRAGKPYKAKAVKDDEAAIASAALMAANAARLTDPWEGDVAISLREQPDGSFHVRVEFLPSERHHGRRWDLQNIPAAVCDALEGVVYANDRQVVALDITGR